MGQTYRVSGTLNHGVELDEKGPDGRKLTRVDVYHDGDEFSTDDAKLEAELRFYKAILLPEEYAAAAAGEGNRAPTEQLASERQALADENAALRARLAELEAAAGSAKSGKSSGKDGE